MHRGEVARRLRAAGIPAHRVALTGYEQQEDIDRAMAAGFDAHIAKPVELVKLEGILRAIQAPETAS
jgi:CheY-like chemotaxis protein